MFPSRPIRTDKLAQNRPERSNSRMDSITCARQFVEAYNSADWDGLKELFTADAVYDEVGTGRRLQGPDEILQANQGWKQAFPDSKGSITGAFADDGDVMLEIT